MIKNISQTQHDYKCAYRLIRLYGEYCEIDRVGTSPYSVILCALISYDNRGDYLFGWVNVQCWRIWKNAIFDRWPDDWPF